MLFGRTMVMTAVSVAAAAEAENDQIVAAAKNVREI